VKGIWGKGFVIHFSEQVRKKEHHFFLGCMGRWVPITSADSANKNRHQLSKVRYRFSLSLQFSRKKA